MKAMFSFGLRLAALSAIYLLLFSAAYALAFAVTGAQPASGDASGNASGTDFVPLIAVAVLNTLVLAAMIARSRWSSHELALTVAYVLYGVGTFMTQIESAVF